VGARRWRGRLRRRPWREYTVAGGLISCGPSLLSAYRQLGAYAGKIHHAVIVASAGSVGVNSPAPDRDVARLGVRRTSN
jgi:hypothetical protein